jgi:hypothetical protein
VGARDERSTVRLIAPAAFVALVIGTIGAFAYAQQLKNEPLVLDKVVFRPATFTPNADCRRDRARVRFRLTRSDRARIEIADRDEQVVKTIVSIDKIIDRQPLRTREISLEQPLDSYQFMAVRWDGRTDRGFLAPPGPYKLRVTLLGQDRELVPPGRFRLHEAPRRPRRGCLSAEEPEPK